MKINVRIESVNNEPFEVPEYATVGSSGFDIKAHCPNGSMTIPPGGRAKISTNLRFILPFGYEIQIRARSGLAINSGIALINGIGTIDSDYRGELGILLINHGTEPFIVTHGMKIAQGVVASVIQASFVVIDHNNRSTVADYNSARGSGGFGSTGC